MSTGDPVDLPDPDMLMFLHAMDPRDNPDYWDTMVGRWLIEVWGPRINPGGFWSVRIRDEHAFQAQKKAAEKKARKAAQGAPAGMYAAGLLWSNDGGPEEPTLHRSLASACVWTCAELRRLTGQPDNQENPQ